MEDPWTSKSVIEKTTTPFQSWFGGVRGITMGSCGSIMGPFVVAELWQKWCPFSRVVSATFLPRIGISLGPCGSTMGPFGTFLGSLGTCMGPLGASMGTLGGAWGPEGVLMDPEKSNFFFYEICYVLSGATLSIVDVNFEVALSSWNRFLESLIPLPVFFRVRLAFIFRPGRNPVGSLVTRGVTVPSSCLISTSVMRRRG